MVRSLKKGLCFLVYLCIIPDTWKYLQLYSHMFTGCKNGSRTHTMNLYDLYKARRHLQNVQA
jgi:hypothetical protein